VRPTAEALPGIMAIDTMMGGREQVTSAYLISTGQPAVIETGPTTSLDALTKGLNELGMGPEDLAHVIVTHVHLDHAGGVGGLARRFPRATVWVHERGAPHLADPTKLVASVARVYGEERMRTLFGPVDPVEQTRIRPISEGDSVDLGDRRIEVIYTPGHASHHVALVDSDTGAVFTGDALGIHLPDIGVLRPATPPPDIDVEASVESISRIRDRAPSVLLFSHYGPVREVEELCELAIRRLQRWAGIVHDAMAGTDNLGRIAEILEVETAGEFGAAPPDVPVQDARARYELLATTEVNASGLVRYWRKREEREEREERGAAGSG
jgi:glyoxylase-like metal-dependent hydrolase (beta-lactamase superfamily II)